MPTLPVSRALSLPARALALLLLAAALVVATLAASPLATEAQAATKCSLSGKKLGPTYTTKLTVTGTTCKTGYSLVTAFYKCRTKGGDKAGRCKGKVSGFTCTEKRGKAIATQYDATVTCKKSGVTVTHAYTQFT